MRSATQTAMIAFNGNQQIVPMIPVKVSRERDDATPFDVAGTGTGMVEGSGTKRNAS